LNTSINNYNTISSLAEYTEQLDMSYDKLFLKSLVESNSDTLIVNSTSFYNKYYDYIVDTTYTVTLSNSEYMKYRYQPKLFCYDVYGTTELWAILLRINNFNSIPDFNSKKIKVFGKNIFNVLNEILINEKENILENKDTVGY